MVGVPVGAAAYLGTIGLSRERDMLIERERAILQRRADSIRDTFLRELARLHEREWTRRFGDGERAPRGIVRDDFRIAPGGGARMRGDAPPLRDIAAFAASAGASELFDADTVPVFAGLFRASRFRYFGDLAARVVIDPEGGRTIEGFLVDTERLAWRFLDPDSPDSVVPNGDERVGRVRLVADDARMRLAGTGPFGLPQKLYRAVAAARGEPPILAPPGYVLSFSARPAASLAADLDRAGSRLSWTLAVVAVVVVLGLLFSWRALRAETRLAERKAEFVSAVSHELRTPLTSIRMYADMLKEGWVDDARTARDYVGLISAESERLTRLVNNVLDFSRIERGSKSFEMRVGDPAPVVRDVAEVLRPYLAEKGFELEIDVPESLPACSFDRDALTQILVNLIDNAVKYGRKEVRLEARARGGEISLRVLDRGPGVAAEDREGIFQPFRRGATAGSTGGSGLGLSLVRHFAEAHGGSIAVADRAGGGAAFEFTIPAA